jgi:hypothetical protein
MSGETLEKETNTGQPPQPMTRLWGIVAFALSYPIYFLFDHYGDPGRARAAGCCGAVIIIAVVRRWELRGRPWFWAAIAIAVALHVPLILLIPWPNNDMPGVSLLPFGLLDYALVYGCIKLAEKLVAGSARQQA